MHLNDSGRLERLQHPLAKALLQRIYHKESNLAVSADCLHQSELLALIDAVGPEICVLKTHIDILEDFTPDLPLRLLEKAQQYNFMIFEDRKFADIGAIVQKQYANGLYRMVDWADLVTVHSLPGSGILEGLRQAGAPKGRGALLLAELSSKGHLMTPDYQQKTVQMADEFADFVVGFVSQQLMVSDGRFLQFTPGVQMTAGGDNLGQQYRTPATAIASGSDVIIVGRGIYQAPDAKTAAAAYRRAGIDALLAKPPSP
jgi:orotidine 5'-phosphate decarboxylase subfamily 1